MKRKTLPHNPKYPLKSFRVIERRTMFNDLDVYLETFNHALIHGEIEDFSRDR